MKQILAFILLAMAISSTLFADSNNTKTISDEQRLIMYQDKLKESLEKLDLDMKANKSDNNITIARGYNTVGFYYNKTKKTAQALKYYLKATAIAEKQKSPYNKLRTIYYNNVGTAYEQLKQYTDALKYYTKALEIYIRVLPAAHPYIASTKYDIGNVHELMGNTDKALKYQIDALDTRIVNLRPLNHADTLASYNKVLKLYRERKEYDMALKYGDQLLDLVSGDTKIELQKKINEIKKLNKVRVKK